MDTSVSGWRDVHAFRKRHMLNDDDNGDGHNGTGGSPSESELSSMSDESEHDLQRYHSAPLRKRRKFLHSDDVGRFASMSIEPESVLAEITPSDVQAPPSPTFRKHGHRPQEDSTAESRATTTNRHAARHFNNAEILPSMVEEPDVDDVRMNRGPNTLQLDNDRFYITSLSDSSSDEDEKHRHKERKRVDRAMQNVTPDVRQRVLQGTQQASEAEHDAPFVVNGELISRFQALDWQRRREIANSKMHLPPQTASPPPSALIVWRKPENISLNFAAAQQRSPSPPIFEHVKSTMHTQSASTADCGDSSIGSMEVD